MSGEGVREIAAAALALAGIAMLALGALGALRFSDVYERIHAARAAGFAAPLLLAALAVLAWDWRIAVKLGLVAATLSLTGPALGHLIAHAAYRSGAEPAAQKKTRR